MTKKKEVTKLSPMLNAAEDMISVVGCCPYYYFDCDNLMVDARTEFIKVHIPWCDVNVWNLDSKCNSVMESENQLTGWKKCWIRYWKDGKRRVPPAWVKVKGPPKNFVEPKFQGDKCPQCGKGELIRRSSERGPFFGCSAFPDCKYTKSIAEEKEEF